MGVTRPALYYYFRSKEELLAAIYDRGVGVLIDRAALLFAQGLAPDALLRKLIEVHVRTMLQERPIVRVYFQEKDSLGEEASRSVKAKEVAFTKMMASTIEAGQAQGIFRPGSPELIVNAILGMLIWVHAWYRPERHAEQDISDVFWPEDLSSNPRQRRPLHLRYPRLPERRRLYLLHASLRMMPRRKAQSQGVKQ
jgi:AcrR family transcriptional regulator